MQCSNLPTLRRLDGCPGNCAPDRGRPAAAWLCSFSRMSGPTRRLVHRQAWCFAVAWVGPQPAPRCGGLPGGQVARPGSHASCMIEGASTKPGARPEAAGTLAATSSYWYTRCHTNARCCTAVWLMILFKLECWLGLNWDRPSVKVVSPLFLEGVAAAVVQTVAV